LIQDDRGMGVFHWAALAGDTKMLMFLLCNILPQSTPCSSATTTASSKKICW
jgi:hypothetical protein